jgi:hypothetical protein
MREDMGRRPRRPASPTLEDRSEMSRRRVHSALVALAAVVAVATGFPGIGAGPAAAQSGSVLRFQTTVLAGGGGEPNVSISPDGRTVLVDGLGGDAQSNDQPAALWRSTDGGRTFTRIQPQFDNTGGGDFDMRWIDNQTVVATDLSIGQGIFVDRSTDGGLHWTQTQIAEDQYDRPWLAVYHQNVYVVAKGFDGIPYCYQSHDGGQTFDPVPIPLYGTSVVPAEAGGQSPTPVEAFVTNNNAYVDHAAIDPSDGDLYVIFGIDSAETYSRQNPVGVPDRLYIAHLVNGAFDVHPIYLGGSGDGFIDGFNWLTIDATGTLYALGNGLHDGHQSLWLSYSTDRGAHWSKLVDVGERGADNVYGAISAGSPGVLAAVYLHGTQPDPNQQQNWYAEVERITGANTAEPQVVRARPIGQPIHTHDICMSGILCGVPGFGNDRNLLDYIWNAVSPDGREFAVVASDGPATGNGPVSVVVLRQVSGPSFGPGVPS